MPTATLTVREVKNKDTGIDISVPTFKEVSAILGTSHEYQVVVVSRLNYFKSPKHKDSDVVQFMVSRTMKDFENLYSKLSEKHSATVFPPFPKKALFVNEAVGKERRTQLEAILKFIALTPKLSTSSILLEFLGVNAIKAGKYTKDIKDTDKGSEGEAKDQSGEEAQITETSKEKKSTFEEDENEQTDDLFGAAEVSKDDLMAFSMSESLIARVDNIPTKMFEDQDFSGGFILEEEEELFVVEGAIEDDKKDNLFKQSNEDDSADILNIDDDLDQLLNFGEKKKRDQDTHVNKPTPSPRTKPKPAPRSGKPLVPKTPVKQDASKPTTENLSTDDIMSYIESNQSQDASDVDLFS